MRGKRTETVKTSVTLDTRQDIDRRAHELGVSASQYVHEVLLIHLYGRDAVLSIHAERLDAIAGGGPKEDQK